MPNTNLWHFRFRTFGWGLPPAVTTADMFLPYDHWRLASKMRWNTVTNPNPANSIMAMASHNP